MTKAIKQFTVAVLLYLFILGVPAAVPAQRSNGGGTASAPKFGNVEGISADRLKEFLTYISSDELEGRDTPSKGLDLAADYIAAHLKEWGIRPAGDDGSYFQKVPLRVSKVVPSSTRAEFAGQTWEYGKDILVSQLANASVKAAPMIFAGYGFVFKGKNIDPYAGLDVKDKVVVVMNGLPKGISNEDFKGPNGGEWSSPLRYAEDHGAKAVMTIASFQYLSNWEAQRWGQSVRGLPSFGPQNTQPKIASLMISPRFAAALFYGEKLAANPIFTRSYLGEPLEGFDLRSEKKVDLNVTVSTADVFTRNVVGILEGSDPVLKKEFVAVGAHYDHVGMNPFSPGPDKIWNGADDDGSGTVSVMSIAEAFAKGREKPRRSILFIWHAGEEKGLWGSEYFTANPTVPIASIITELNIDMIGRYQRPGDENHPENKALPKPGEVFTIGSRMMSTELGDLSDRVNKDYLGLKFNTKYDDPNDPEQFFYRSDHFNYAKHGVPIIFFMDGSHADYHQPSDSIEKIDFAQMEKVAKTIMATAWELSNRDKRPVVDKPLPASVTGN